MLGKTLREVVAALAVSESSLRAFDEPPGRFWIVECNLTGCDAKATIYLRYETAINSPDRKVPPTELLDKIVTGIAVSFPLTPQKPEIVVGSASPDYKSDRDTPTNAATKP